MSIFDTLGDHGVTASKYRKNTVVTGDQLNLRQLGRNPVYSWGGATEWRIDGIAKDPDSDSVFFGGYSTSSGGRYLYKSTWNSTTKAWQQTVTASPAPTGNPSKMAVPSGQSFFFVLESTNIIRKRNKSDLAVVTSWTAPVGTIYTFKVAPTNDKLYIYTSEPKVYVYDFSFNLIRTIIAKTPSGSSYGWAGKYLMVTYLSGTYNGALYDCEAGTETLNTSIGFNNYYSGMNEGIVTGDGHIICVNGAVRKFRISDLSVVTTTTHPSGANYSYQTIIVDYDKDYYLTIENYINNTYKGRRISKATLADAGYAPVAIDFTGGYNINTIDPIFDGTSFYFGGTETAGWLINQIQLKFKLV